MTDDDTKDTKDTLQVRVELCFGLHQTPELHAWREACDLWGFASPGARGWLLELVRDAWGDEHMVTSWSGSGWWSIKDSMMAIMDGENGRPFAVADTEAEALVAALEASP